MIDDWSDRRVRGTANDSRHRRQPSTVLQMIAVVDIGKYAAACFTDAERLKGAEFDIAGDQRTMPETAEVLGKALGRFRWQRSARTAKTSR